MSTVKKTYGITLDQAQEHLEMWMEAEIAVTTSQSYQLGSRSLTRANLEEIRETIDYWNQKVSELLAAQNGGRNKVRRGVPRDL